MSKLESMSRKRKFDSSVSPKNEEALARAKEFEKFAAQKGDMVSGAEDAAVSLDYEAVAEIARKGQELAEDDEAWREFITLPFWTVEVKKGRPKQKHRAEAIRYMLRRYRGSSELHSKQASERWRAVQVLLADGVKPHRMAAILEKRGGYRGINRRKHEKSLDAASKSPSAVVMLEADFGERISSLTSLRTPCKVKIIATIEKVGKTTQIHVLKLRPLMPRT